MNLRRVEHLHEAAANGRLRIARNGQELGEFSISEVLFILERQDGGLLLTDYVLDSRSNEWKRLSEVLSEPPSMKAFLIGCAIIAVASLIMARLFLGSWRDVWDLF